MKRVSKKEREDLVQDYVQSGLSCVEYCRKNDIHPNTLYRWKKQFEQNPDAVKSFVEVTAPVPLSSKRQNNYIEIRTKNVRVQIPVTIGNEQIAFLFGLMGLAHVS